jgi:hypothetical protein
MNTCMVHTPMLKSLQSVYTWQPRHASQQDLQNAQSWLLPTNLSAFMPLRHTNVF